MPTFGDFETIDEPIESRDDNRQFTRVWQAARISVKDGRLYAVKCYIPRHGRRADPAPKEDLEEHRSLEFIEGVKQIKKAAADAQERLTPIHEFGLTPTGDGAWYVTDFYGDATPILPRTLRSYITRGGKVDAEALRHTIHSIVLGCLALKRSRGWSHGNLKPTNIFRAGKPRALRKTPLVLGDAFPVAPLQLGELDAKNKLEVGDLIKATVEAHDLHAIGALILQLVEVRLMTREGDFDYPLAPAPVWEGLGKDGERWRQLCNQLLDPSLSLEKQNLELLEKELRPGFVSTHTPQLAGAAVLFCLVVGGGFLGWRYYEGAKADRRQKLYDQDMDGARSALTASDSDPGKVMDALKLVEDALRVQPSDPNATQLKTDVDAKRESLFDKEISQGKNDLAAKKFEESVAEFKVATTLKPDDADAKSLLDNAQTQLAANAADRQKEVRYQSAMTAGRLSFGRSDYKDALAKAGKALTFKADDADAKQLRDESQAKITAISQANQTEADYQAAMKNGRAALASGDTATASTEAGKALSLKPSDADAKQLSDAVQTKVAAVNAANQKEADYQAALKNGRTALVSGDTATALTEAGNALTLKPGDADATQLRDAAQTKQAATIAASQKEADYKTAMQNGRTALASGDTATASTEAGRALALKPGDTDAKQLSYAVQTKIAAVNAANQKEADYQAAMKKGRAALANGDTATALTEAGKALALRPGDTDAKQLSTAIQAKLDAIKTASQREADYQAAMKNGRAALTSGDTATALTESGRALVLKPGDSEAQQLNDAVQAKVAETKAAAQKEGDYQAAMKNGRAALANGDTATALTEAAKALSIKHDDADAAQLRDDAQKKQAAANDANQKEANYQTAMKSGRAALAKGDTATALTEVSKAISLKPGDADAKQLNDAVQAKVAEIKAAGQKEADYQAAMKNGRAALASGDSATALTQAGKALSIKHDDADAQQLRDDAQKKQAAANDGTLKEANYQAAMTTGRAAFAKGDNTGALEQALKALSIKHDDADAKKLRDQAQKKVKTNSLAAQTEADYQAAMKSGREALAHGDFKAASDRADDALLLRTDDADAQHLRDEAQAKLTGKTQRPQPTNFAGVFGRSIPDLDFVWVDGIGTGGSGAYAAVNELSWEQYQALGGREKPLDAAPDLHRPADLDFDKALALIDALNRNPAYNKVSFRLPSLDEYKILADVPSFDAIGGLLSADKTVGEKFQGSKIHPREITADVAANRIGLRNVIGNVREWTDKGVPFGNSYAWGAAGTHSLTELGRTASGDEQIGLRLICEPKN